MPFVRGVALAVVSCALLAASVLTARADEERLTEAVIPPGEEALIASMLGRGAALPDCTLISCGVHQIIIDATYDCLGDRVTLELAHPQNATDTSTLTSQFAISVLSGTPPPDFQHAFLSLVRSYERDFVWAWAESGSDVENADAPQ